MSILFFCCAHFFIGFFIFFFYCFLVYLFLHSFPTRRSSDLACRSVSAVLFGPSYKRRTARLGERSFQGALFRSEEHTSELQSLRHLVCRLLLEKKKN